MSRAYFCYSHEEDRLKVQEVYGCWLHARPDNQVAGIWDSEVCSLMDEGKVEEVESWLDRQLNDTKATVVLIGSHTASSPWVLRGIQKSIERGNQIVGIAINAIPDSDGTVSLPGVNPLSRICFADSGVCVATRYPVYQWVCDGGQHNLCGWIEQAAGTTQTTVPA